MSVTSESLGMSVGNASSGRGRAGEPLAPSPGPDNSRTEGLKMVTSLLLLAALAVPGQADGLTLTDARLTYGLLGPKRDSAKFLPGDGLYLAFMVDGVTVAADGKVQYSIALEVAGPGGKTIFRQPPRDEEVINSLGGSRLPAFAQVQIGQEQAPGEYTLKVTVTDRATKKSASLEQKAEVLPKAFGLVHLTTTDDQKGQMPAGVLGVGQSLYVNSHVIGFQRGGGGQPNVAVELRVLDEAGKPTLAKSLTGRVDKGVPPKDPVLPVQFLLSLNRAGKFTVELKVTDEVAGKTATQTFPLTVHEAK
jgi:hypothetical protein